MECWYKNNCKQYHEGCACLRYDEMVALFQQSNIPEGRWGKISLTTDVDISQFRRLAEIKRNIKNWVEGGNNLYLYSRNFGNGKTSWAIKLMQSYFNSVWPGNRFRRRGVFFSVPEFIDREHIRMNGDDEEFDELREALVTCDLVVWDDVSAVKLTDYSHSVLLNFIDTRLVNNKCNIFTGNLDGERLGQFAGGRLASRIWNESEIIQFNGPDRRGQ